jgi:hypothetical protein
MSLANNIAAHNGDKTGQRQIRILAGNNNRAFNHVTFHPTSSRAGIENSTSSQLARNVIGDPRFVPPFNDLHLPALNAAIDAGDPSFAAGESGGRTSTHDLHLQARPSQGSASRPGRTPADLGWRTVGGRTPKPHGSRRKIRQ